MSDNRPAVYQQDDTTVYRASQYGTCMRALAAARKGLQPNEQDGPTSTVLAEGVIHEEHILKAMDNAGWTILGRGQEEVELVVTTEPRVVVRGHIDEMCRDKTTSETGLVEVKTMSEAVFRKWKLHRWESQPKYAWQFSIYWHALNPDFGIMATKNRNTGETDYYVVTEPPFTLEQIVERGTQIEQWAQMESWPPCDSKESWWCPFVYLHDGYTPPSPTDEQEEFVVTDDFTDLVAEFHRLGLVEDAARHERMELRPLILERMADRREIANIPNFHLLRREVVQRRLDNQLVKKLLSKQQTDECTVENPVEYLVVTPKHGSN